MMSYVKYRIFDADWSILKISSMYIYINIYIYQYQVLRVWFCSHYTTSLVLFCSVLFCSVLFFSATVVCQLN